MVSSMSENNRLEKQLKGIQNRLDQVVKTQESILGSLTQRKTNDASESAYQGRMSYFAFISSILLSSLIGVVGNLVVTLWFQPATLENRAVLGLSIGLLGAFLSALFVELRWIRKQFKSLS